MSDAAEVCAQPMGFLGLVSYYQQSIKDVAALTAIKSKAIM